MPEPAATPATLAQSTDRVCFIERFYSMVAGGSDDRICLTLREDLQTDALHAAYTVEAWLEEVQGREEKYDRLATLARAVSPICDLLRILSKGVYTDFYEDLISAYEKKHLQSLLAQRYELRQSAGEVDTDDLPALGEDPLAALLAIVSEPDGRDDYVAWFQIGWLYWKRGVLGEAENAFRTAASFSQRQSPWYCAQSLRHEAFMQWLRKNFERCRTTIRRAIEIRRDPAMLVEAGRYSMSCGQQLESQSLIDEALHADPFIFVSVLSDSAFAAAVTSTVDILVRQQTRATEIAKGERIEWEDTMALIRQAEKAGSITLLPETADDEFNVAALPAEPDFPTAIFRTDQAKTRRGCWAATALQMVEDDLATKTRLMEEAEEGYRLEEHSFNSRLNSVDTEQRIAELVIQDEHDLVTLPSIPPLKDEMLNGLMIGVAVLVAGIAVLAVLSQWRFGSIPPLSPISTGDIVLISPLLLVMVVFGLLGFVTLPLIRLRKATSVHAQAAQSADFDADLKLKKVANESARQREDIRQGWTTRKVELQSNLDAARLSVRAAVQAHTAIKRIPHLQK